MPPNISMTTNLFQDNQCISKAWWDARVTWTDFPTATNREKKHEKRPAPKRKITSQPAIFRGEHVSFRRNNRTTCHKLVLILKTFAKMYIIRCQNRFVEPPGHHRTTNMCNIVLQVELGCLNERKPCWIKPLKKLTAKYPGGRRSMLFVHWLHDWKKTSLQTWKATLHKSFQHGRNTLICPLKSLSGATMDAYAKEDKCTQLLLARWELKIIIPSHNLLSCLFHFCLL